MFEIKKLFADYPFLLELGKQLRAAKGKDRIEVFYQQITFRIQIFRNLIITSGSNMQHFYFFGVIFLILLTVNQNAKGNETTSNQKQKVLALLDRAEEALSKARHYFPACENNHSKSLSFLAISKSIVLDIKELIMTGGDLNEPDSRPRECSEILAKGFKESGVYNIWPTAGKSIKVYCDMETEGGGWTVIQRRGNFWKQHNFHQNWQSYKVGFGNINRDFWLGNENIYNLTNQGTWEIRFDLTDKLGEARYAVYNNFRIEDENFDYTLRIGNYRGNAGDNFKFHNGKKFSTTDRGDNRDCSNINKGGWWYNHWAYVHLNGLYQPDVDAPQSIHWFEWLKNKGLASTEMKIRLRKN
ncbi:techylectin-5A [Trichonephila clavata]|uniref:Techylectin-5A n=1 Tax=Trichonephila clavata TaxID=2740835 RepID=A0A8X6FK74_TRICU|nr:techylectin-5A [Trichonephila clavata]